MIRCSCTTLLKKNHLMQIDHGASQVFCSLYKLCVHIAWMFCKVEVLSCLCVPLTVLTHGFTSWVRHAEEVEIGGGGSVEPCATIIISKGHAYMIVNWPRTRWANFCCCLDLNCFGFMAAARPFKNSPYSCKTCLLFLPFSEWLQYLLYKSIRVELHETLDLFPLYSFFH